MNRSVSGLSRLTLLSTCELHFELEIRDTKEWIYILLLLIGGIISWRNTKVNKLVAVGLFMMLVRPLAFAFLEHEIVDYSFIELIGPYFQYLFLGGIAAIIIGTLKGGSVDVVRQTSRLEPTQEEMTSLIIPRNDSNSFTAAEHLRDTLYANFEDRCQKKGVKVIGFKSHAQSPNVWLRFDYLLPTDSDVVSLRASTKIDIERFDFHRWPLEMTVTLSLGMRQKTYRRVTRVDNVEIDQINEYLAGSDVWKPYLKHRTREWPLQLWRPKNKVTRLGTDWPVAIWGMATVAAFFLPKIGPLLTVLSGIALAIYVSMRKTYILTTGRPKNDPRDLVRMDSWQVNIEKLGPSAEAVRTAVMEKLQSATAAANMRIAPEKIWYPGVDGKVEREQIVVRFRRGLGFVHVESYGDDLYVGWDTHVNSGNWIEERLQVGRDKETQLNVSANRVVAGWQIPSEYDVTDAVFLTEWLHGVLTRVVKLKMEEQRIDQEIDFTIQRESRRGVLNATPPTSTETPANKKTRKSPFDRLRRLA
ncbi:MAG: hypothetical protein ACI8UO_004750 [Verrucomicrobiales bacterium]